MIEKATEIEHLRLMVAFQLEQRRRAEHQLAETHLRSLVNDVCVAHGMPNAVIDMATGEIKSE